MKSFIYKNYINTFDINITKLQHKNSEKLFVIKNCLLKNTDANYRQSKIITTIKNIYRKKLIKVNNALKYEVSSKTFGGRGKRMFEMNLRYKYTK